MGRADEWRPKSRKMAAFNKCVRHRRANVVPSSPEESLKPMTLNHDPALWIAVAAFVVMAIVALVRGSLKPMKARTRGRWWLTRQSRASVRQHGQSKASRRGLIMEIA